MKKLLLILYVIVGLVIASPIKINGVKVYDRETINEIKLGQINQLSGGTEDKHIDIEITKNGNQINIYHTSDINITHAVIEYAFIEDGKKIANLGTFSVSGNVANVNSNVYAVKVHQVLTTIDNVVYRYMTSNKNTAGDLSGVERQGFLELKTTYVDTLETNFLTNQSGEKKYFEFYFDMPTEHDELIWVDTQYVIIKKTWFGLKEERENRERKVEDGKYIQKWVLNPDYDRFDEWSMQWLPENSNVLELESTTKHNANYVVRIAPTHISGKLETGKLYIENFAIIRVKYMLEGEFFIDDAINNPTTPDNPDLDLGIILDFIEKVKEIISSLSSFFTKNFGAIGIVIIVIIILILMGPFILVVKGIWSVVKLIFKGIKQIFLLPKKLFILFKFLFIPPDKKKK